MSLYLSSESHSSSSGRLLSSGSWSRCRWQRWVTDQWPRAPLLQICSLLFLRLGGLVLPKLSKVSSPGRKCGLGLHWEAGRGAAPKVTPKDTQPGWLQGQLLFQLRVQRIHWPEGCRAVSEGLHPRPGYKYGAHSGCRAKPQTPQLSPAWGSSSPGSSAVARNLGG